MMKKSLGENQNKEQKEFLSKMKLKMQKLSKGKLSLIIGVAIAIFLCIGLLFSNFNKIKFQPSSEIARSMTYDRVKEGDEAINRYRLCKV